jgi:hypothetical protein
LEFAYLKDYNFNSYDTKILDKSVSYIADTRFSEKYMSYSLHRELQENIFISYCSHLQRYKITNHTNGLEIVLKVCDFKIDGGDEFEIPDNR